MIEGLLVQASLKYRVVSLCNTLFPLLSTGLTQEVRPDITEILMARMLRIKSNKQNISEIRNR